MLAEEMLKWFRQPTNLWLKDFAHLKGMHWQQFSQLAEKDAEFSFALKMAKEIQESKLVKVGLSKRANVGMAVFALKNNHGWRDHMTVESTATVLLADADPKESLKRTLKRFGLKLLPMNGNGNGNGHGKTAKQ